jgi:hypothetical protein
VLAQKIGNKKKKGKEWKIKKITYKNYGNIHNPTELSHFIDFSRLKV